MKHSLQYSAHLVGKSHRIITIQLKWTEHSKLWNVEVIRLIAGKKTTKKHKNVNNIDYGLGLSCRGRDRMVVGFTTTCAISAYHH